MLLTLNTGLKGSWMTMWLLEIGVEVAGLAPGPPTNPSLYDLASLAANVAQHAIDNADDLAAAVRDSRLKVVMHMAAQPSVRRSFIDSLETDEANVTGTVNLFEVVRTAG